MAGRVARSDVTIDGDPDATRAVRFNIYHLLIAANESDPRVSIGANSLSGERYRGHAVRGHRGVHAPVLHLHAARHGPRTAAVPLPHPRRRQAEQRAATEDSAAHATRWESADTGVETTPKWTVDGAHRIWMGEEEIHVTAAVAYGLIDATSPQRATTR